MSLIFSLLAITLFGPNATAAAIDPARLPSGFDLKAAIHGDYGNARGDKAKVAVMPKSQGDLFLPPVNFVNFAFFADKQRGGWWANELELTGANFQQVSPDGSVIFSQSVDCDDPGCTRIEAELVFKKKRDGSYYLVAKLNFESEENEDFSAWSGKDLDEATEEDLNAYCKETFGSDAEGFLNEYDAYCLYSRVYTLKKLN